MTCQELIDKLRTFPPEAIVIYRCCSDWADLEAEEVTLIQGKGEEKSYAQQVYQKWLVRQPSGNLMQVDSRWIPKDLEEGLEPLTAVAFPGN